ncbi:MAG: type II toxin-antitoxin system HipA family toxin [Planctomycetes bacterium]|nr:type II toxin-antitoxin system HipA family toxin [Planctomycetota bacterium]
MSETVHVYVDLEGEAHYVGRLWVHMSGRREAATFQYDDSWLSSPRKFALEPALMLGSGDYHTDDGKALFGSLGDSAPDRWGRLLMSRAAKRSADARGKTPRFLREVDYLLGVHDYARQGALRFAMEKGGVFLAKNEGMTIPPLVELPRLLAAADSVADDRDDDIRFLLAPGSSLGGARPKASVIDTDGGLAIAKFPQKNDAGDTVTWEAVAVTMAEKAGISVHGWRKENVAGRPVLLLPRFDRQGTTRIPFLSAMSMIGAKNRETRSYLEIADALRLHGVRPQRDLAELWRRIVFTVLISNVDDHMRNHGFLYDGESGWALSPVYDVNPTPAEERPRILSSTIDESDATASLDLAFEVAEYFGLTANEARRIASEAGTVVGGWRQEAASAGLSGQEIDRMTSAFEHRDLDAARRL